MLPGVADRGDLLLLIWRQGVNPAGSSALSPRCHRLSNFAEFAAGALSGQPRACTETPDVISQGSLPASRCSQMAENVESAFRKTESHLAQ
jgi:hypothetical protein